MARVSGQSRHGLTSPPNPQAGEFLLPARRIRNFCLTDNTVCNTVCATYYMAQSNGQPGELFENLKLELRRGCLIVAVLGQLRTEQYGYTLRKALNDDG